MCRNINDDVAYLFFLLNLICSSVIPFLFLAITNTVLIRGVRQSVRMSRAMSGRDINQTTSRSAKVSSMTTTLILTSFSFLVLTVPVCVSDMYLEETGYYEGTVGDVELNAKLALFETIVLLMWTSNCSINFYLYILSGRKFRQESKKYLCLTFRRKQTSS
ncbi:hypothetical protein ACOMHN_055088 [Nucella lapillus]